ncbi:MAG TPA: tetratricopeptide repeat protein [Acidimicrobiales bacterium]|nr:tetratricopeptide repeat protein [Acidimicrobiales bacterium]
MSAPALPAGEVTLLFTDVEGSTRLWELHGDRMLALLGEHDRIVAAAVADAGGVLQLSRAEGDSSFAVFADARAALRGAVALQRGMASHPWPPDLRIRTRAALHTGNVEVRGDTYYGPVVNRCVRLRSLAHGGQTILSKATLDAASHAGGLPRAVTVADLGTHRLKDLAVPERVYELRHAELATGFPPLRSPDVERHNLPDLLGSFVGRRDEQRSVTKALDAERLVTLVGTGGVGKTRLALEVAWARITDDAPTDGTWFVNLTGARSASEVEGVLASAIGAREQPGRPLAETITEQLGDQAALVVLDNCEHVLSAVRPLVAALLSRCPNVRVLATSREALGLAGERRRAVAGLPLRDAVELFADRSGLAGSGGDDEAGGAVARLCDRLDGIPLAIEIAAARAAELGPDAVERGVARTQVEAAGRSVLEATLAWSHDLLQPDEQALFRRLGIFAGQFTLSAAEAVVIDESLDAFEVLDLLDALVQRSLVLPTDDGGYRQLFVVRETAARLAREAGEHEALAASHLAWCVALATRLRAPGLDERERFDPLRQVGDELLAALARHFDGDLGGVQVQLAGALEEFWYLRGAFTEGRAHLESVLARGSGFRSHRAEVHRSAGFLARCQGDLQAAADHLEASLGLFNEIVTELRDGQSPHLPLFEHHVAKTLSIMSEVALLRGDRRAAIALATDALALPTPAAGSAALLLGLAERAAGDLDAADRHIAQALRFGEESGDEALLADCLRNLGVIARAGGDLAAAEAYYRRALSIERGSAREQVLARTLLSLAELLAITGGDATDLLDEGLGLARALGDRQAEAHGLSTLAELTACDDIDEATALHSAALSLRESVGTREEVALSQVRVAALADLAGRWEEALTLAAAAAGSFRGLDDNRGATEALAVLTAVHARRGDVAAGVATLTEALERSALAPTAVERADVLDGAAWLALRQGRPQDARALFDAAGEQRRALGVVASASAVVTRREMFEQVRGQKAADKQAPELLEQLVTAAV